MTTGKEKIFIPDLPKWSSIRKYIKQIDESKIYSNFGPLNIKFMERLEDHWNKSAKTITTSSGTSALIGAILAQNNLSKNSDKICILPSYTFVGTICAVIASGYKPFLVDIDIKTWDIDIESLKKLDFFKEISLIVPVSIYGRNVDILKWENFSSEFNIPIVIDAAASFDTLDSTYLSNLNNCILCLSFHATKVLGVGEGGCIILPKDKNLEAYLRTINFGFFQTRDSIGASINGKMSEYHAAIGLAGLDTWPDKLNKLNQIRNSYRKHADRIGIGDQLICGENISLSYCFFYSDNTEKLASNLSSIKIASKIWYDYGIHMHPEYKNIPHSELKNTLLLSKSLLGIPMHSSLKGSDIKSITKNLRKFNK